MILQNMNRKIFFALISVSSLASLMLVIDGAFSRISLEKYQTQSVGEQLTDFAFWPLWLPLMLVQLVVVVLALRGGVDAVQRNIITFMIFIFVTASMYSFIGHDTLVKELAKL